MSKKLIFSLVILTSCLGISLPALMFSQNKATVYLHPATQTVAQGEVVLIYFNVASVNDLYSLQISLKYDSNLLKYEDVSEGSFLNENGQANTFRINPLLETGLIKGYGISRIGQVPGIFGSGTLAIFRFRALALGTAQVTILTSAQQGTKLLNSDLDSIDYLTMETTVTIRASQDQPSEDKQPPFIKSTSPAKNALDVPRDTGISLKLTDTGAGVDPQSIILTVNQSRITPQISQNDADYLVSYQSAEPFNYNQMITITVDAKDLAAMPNVMPQERYSFITEAEPDTTPPLISQINVAEITPQGARITWRTDESATSIVKYKPSGVPGYYSESNFDHLVRQHSISLDNFQPGTDYVFQVSSRDYQGNLASSAEQSFQTLASADVFEGELVKGSGANVYLIEKGKKRLIVTAQIFESHGWQWSKIFTLSEEKLNGYPLEENVALGRQGQLVKGSSSRIYLITQDKKRPILSATAFESHGFKWSEIISLSEAELDTYPESANLSLILKNSRCLAKLEHNPNVWLIEKEVRRYLRSREIFESYQLRWQDIQTIDSSEMASYPLCRLIKSPSSPNIYYLNSALEKRWLSSIQALNAWADTLDYDQQKIIEVNQQELESYETGQNINV